MKRFLSSLVAWGALAGVLIALKLWHQTATPESLRFVLAPVTVLVEIFSGLHFSWLPGQGYYSSEVDVLINKGCAGINFGIICLGMIGLVALTHGFSRKQRTTVVITAPVVAYALLLLANASRITVALRWNEQLVSRFLPNSWDAHETLGIVVYFTVLTALYYLLSSRTRTSLTQ